MCIQQIKSTIRIKYDNCYFLMIIIFYDEFQDG